jgi:pimeloyl-ACP methyl ester carboxylesterase
MCRKNAQEIGPYIGTASTARDVMQIVDALDDGPLLNYYGPSYGTVLGATLVAMFPDRVGSVVIDGVLNPHEFNKALVNTEYGAAADAAFSEFFERCVKASPELCPLNQHGTTAPELEAKIWEFIESVKHHPIALPAEFHDFDAWFLGTKVDYSGLHNAITTTLYHPPNFPLMASALQGMLEGDFANLAAWRNWYNNILPGVAQAESFQGIFCADRVPRAVSEDQSIPDIQKASAISRLVGQDWLNTMTTTPCAQWPFEAKGRYLGDFKVKTKNPVLVVGNTLDNVTPLASARNVSSGFGGSILLERKAFGVSISFDYIANAYLHYFLAYLSCSAVQVHGRCHRRLLCEEDYPRASHYLRC